MTNFEIRRKFLKFFKKKQHKVLPGSSLIPDNDPSLLFVNAGMNQFKNVFLGLETLPYKDVVTIQKCLRAGGKHNDIESVGETPLHHTFFEMFGNFSFGGYFKKKAVALAWEFLTQELKLPPENLWVSVYEKDEESYEIWRRDQKIPEHKIYLLGEKDNFWQMGETGPCGPCTEIHYYKGKERRPDPRQFMEVWNLVFMEFYDTEGGKRQKLSVPCVDTGMGLERLCSVLQNKKSNYHTDLFRDILLALEKSSGCKYDFDEKNQTDQQKAFRVLADHSRAISFLIADGVVAGNDRESYVLRRIIRRALYYSQKLDSRKNLLQAGVEKTISLMAETGFLFKQEEDLSPIADIYLSPKQEEKNIQSVIERETKRFSDSLKMGRKQLEETMESLPEKFIPAQTIWNLYSTYGFPMDLTRLIAREKGWTVAEEEDIKKHEERLRHKLKKTVAHVEIKNFIKQYSPHLIPELQNKAEKTDFTGYEKNREKSRILLIASTQMPDDVRRDEGAYGFSAPWPCSKFLKEGHEGWLVFDKSCFYPEGGGPVGDKGLLETETGKAEVLDCQKEGNFIWHRVIVLNGRLEEDQQCQMEVNTNYRKEISNSHTATHLLNAALRSVLGESVRQAGSLVEPGRLRFDFTYPKALTKKECGQVEELIWQSIEKEEKLSSSFKSLEQAKKEGALFLQGENYGPKVRVISIGEKTSKELCGGIHVQNTGKIGSFKIVSEKGIQSGVRRIIAYTGSLAKAWESFLIKQNLEIREYLNLPLPKKEKTNPLFFKKEKTFWKGLIEKQNLFLNWMANKEREIKTLRKKIVQLEEKNLEASFLKNQDFIKIKSRFHPLALQNLELREHLRLSPPKVEKVINSFLKPGIPDETSSSKEQETKKFGNGKIKNFNLTKRNLIMQLAELFEESENPLHWLKAREGEIKKRRDQLKEIKALGRTQEKLLKKATDFKLGGVKGKLLVADFPLEDRKILSDLSDSLLSKISSGLVVVSGEGEGKYPILVNRTKNFEELLSAGDILKNTIVPLCGGKGGGKASYAEGSVIDKSALSHLERILLEKWGKL